VTLAHGSGGKLTHHLIEKLFVTAFGNPVLEGRHDGAVMTLDKPTLAFTTDSFVVKPLFFPGGDIGKLAVTGTVNDLAMCGARPQYLSAAFIIEEGLPMQTLWEIIQSMQQTALEAGVQIVTGDTKVVDKGKGDGVFINTAGVGVPVCDQAISPRSVKPGDALILSGDIGRHGMAIMASRENLAFESAIESDCAPLVTPVMRMLEAAIEVHCLRDLTRGGLASALVEIAEASGYSAHIDEALIAVRDDVRAACEIMGFDPLYVANEGRFVAYVAPQDADRALAILRDAVPDGAPSLIGSVNADDEGMVTMRSVVGANRIVDMLAGEQLPRIC
jgi:hydrogenase expression/formation protein HypE